LLQAPPPPHPSIYENGYNNAPEKNLNLFNSGSLYNMAPTDPYGRSHQEDDSSYSSGLDAGRP
jgi:hypothetical protein